jgi:nitronate monooxygenase
MALSTAFTELFGVRHPIALAPMGGFAGGALAAPVSNGGGLGLLGAGYGDADWLAREAALVAESTSEPWGVGFLSWAIDIGAVERALECSPRAVMLSFGDQRAFAEAVRRASVPLIIQVTDLAEAREAVDLGADVIVAQGTEAGGHGPGTGGQPCRSSLSSWTSRPRRRCWRSTGSPTAGAWRRPWPSAPPGRSSVPASRLPPRRLSSRRPPSRSSRAAGKTLSATACSISPAAPGGRPGTPPGPSATPSLTSGVTVRRNWPRTPAPDRPTGGGIACGDLPPRPVWATQAIDLITDLLSAADLVGALAAQADDALARAGRRRRPGARDYG